MAGCATTEGSSSPAPVWKGSAAAWLQLDEVVVEATGNAMAVVRVLSPFVGRVIVANPMQVKAIAHDRIKTDKIDVGVLA
ncbi:hypothetical protein X771_11390 [Mesorhizobium sp. LSJC277A00]|nr:hypothetical protein X771_11390 [Mesorhizobium sp. LSJC277A00]